MNPTVPLLRLRLLLGAVLVLSVAAAAAVLFTPTSARPRPGQVFSSSGQPVQVDLRVSHPVLSAATPRVMGEVTVTLDRDLAPAEHVSLAVVLDRSGSMSGAKMEDARRAVHRLVELLRDGDELAVISFSSDVQATPLRRITEDARRQLHAELDALQISGGTNVGLGLEQAERTLRDAHHPPRMVLISDGQPTEGRLSTDDLARQVAELHARRITVTALGVGVDYDGALLARLSEEGGGMCGHLQDAARLEEVLGQELDAARAAVARGVELELTLDGVAVRDVPGRHPQSTWAGARQVVRLPLADLRPHLPTRVIVELAPEGRLRDGMEVSVQARVTWAQQREPARSSQVALQVPVVDEVDESQRDEAVFARGVTALANVRMLAAASAYERGDDHGGAGLLDEAKALFGMSADALAGAQEADALRSKYRAAGTIERKTMNYGLQKKALSNFGRENEGY